MSTTVLPADYVDHTLIGVDDLTTALRGWPAHVWLLLAVAAAVEPDRRIAAVQQAEAIAMTTNRAALLEVVRERVTDTLTGAAVDVCPNPAQVRTALEAALIAAVLAPDLHPDLTSTLLGPLRAFRTLTGRG